MGDILCFQSAKHSLLVKRPRGKWTGLFTGVMVRLTTHKG